MAVAATRARKMSTRQPARMPFGPRKIVCRRPTGGGAAGGGRITWSAMRRSLSARIFYCGVYAIDGSKVSGDQCRQQLRERKLHRSLPHAQGKALRPAKNAGPRTTHDLQMPYQFSFNANWNWRGSYAAVGCPAMLNSGLTAATFILLAMLKTSAIRSMLKRSPK